MFIFSHLFFTRIVHFTAAAADDDALRSPVNCGSRTPQNIGLSPCDACGGSNTERNHGNLSDRRRGYTENVLRIAGQ